MKPQLTLLGLALSLAPGFGASTVNLVNRFAWGANVGWLDWRADGAGGANLGMYVCSGHIYAANLGWIYLGSGTPGNGIRYQNLTAADTGVNHDQLGNLSGYAYGANVGWLNFGNNYPPTTPRPRIDLLTGQLSGFVYGANIGWISLSNSIAFVQTDSLTRGADTDTDGMADAWEHIHAGNLTTMSATTDRDGDGVPDPQEYAADTDPFDPVDQLLITDLALDSGQATLSWRSRPTRFYQIQHRYTLDGSGMWMTSLPGLQMPDTGVTTTRSLPPGSGAQRYFRIIAIWTLSP